MPLSRQQRDQTERRIRAAMDRLLSGPLPADGGCDIKTLAVEAGISRASLYRTFGHLKDEFQQRRDALLAQSGHPDPREQRITRLREHNSRLTGKLVKTHTELRALKQQHQQALSALAAADDTIQRLRRQLAQPEDDHREPRDRPGNLITFPAHRRGHGEGNGHDHDG